MRARLLIRFASEPELPHQWLRLDANGRPDGGVASGTLADAAAAAAGRPAIGLLPGFDVLLLSARIPTQSRQKLLRAIPFALEDQLADDVEDLHFVPGRRDGDELTVAVIAKARLQQWLDACEEAGLELERVQPDTLAVPYEEDAWTLLLEEHSFLLRTGIQSGFQGDRLTMLPLLQATLEEAETRPTRLLVYSASGDEAVLDELDIQREEYRIDEPLMLLAGHLNAGSLDLQTGDFARKHNLGGHWRRWQAVAALLLAWIVVDTGAAYVQQWQYRQELAALTSEIQQLYRESFGGANPPPLHLMRSTVQNRLEAMRGGGGRGDTLLDMLSRVGPVLQAERDIQLNGLSYRNGEIDLEFTAPSLQAVDQLKQKLDSVSGIAAEVRNARAEGDRAQGRLRIGAS